MPLPTVTNAALGTFRNLSHPTINAHWSRKKSDGEDKSANAATKLLGINWVPVYVGEAPHPDARVDKKLVCGMLRKADLFIGLAPTREYDWNLHIAPDDSVYVNTTLLEANARRITQSKLLNFNWIAEGSGKWFDTREWHWDPDSTPRRVLIEAEVSPPRVLLNGPAQPFPCRNAPCNLQPATRTAELAPQPLDRPERICAYGPWVQEALHYFRPEIHPAEGLVWRAVDGSIHALMLQDASNRFDASQDGVWITTRTSGDVSRSEHWVQPAMLAEYTIAVPNSHASNVRVELLGQQGLEPVGHGGFLTAVPAPIRGEPVAADPLVTSLVGPRLVEGDGGSPAGLVLRAQIRGEVPGDSLSNNGAYAYFRITGIPVIDRQ